jgi:hypothetical protein
LISRCDGLQRKPQAILNKKLLIPTGSEDEFLYKHFNVHLGFARINLTAKTCTCFKYLDKGVCKHLIAACLMNQVNLPGLVQLPKLFKVIRRKKIRQYRDDSRSEEQMNGVEEQPVATTVTQLPAQMPAQMQAEIPAQMSAEMPVEIPAQIPAQMPAEIPAQMPAEMPAEIPAQMPAEPQAQMSAPMQAKVSAEIPAQIPPKKRGPKPKAGKSNLGGRPPLAKKALEDDSEPILRRSARTKKL